VEARSSGRDDQILLTCQLSGVNFFDYLTAQLRNFQRHARPRAHFGWQLTRLAFTHPCRKDEFNTGV
jgi:hypothetical protein